MSPSTLHSTRTGWWGMARGSSLGTWHQGRPAQALVQVQLWLPFEVSPGQALVWEQGAEDRIIAQDLVPGPCGETRSSETSATAPRRMGTQRRTCCCPQLLACMGPAQDGGSRVEAERNPLTHPGELLDQC